MKKSIEIGLIGVFFVFTVLAISLLVGCGKNAAPPVAAPVKQKPVEIQVLAASSQTEAFTEIKTVFEKAHPNVTVNLSFASSSSLRAQIENGAKPEVFASADEKNIKIPAGNGLIDGEYVPYSHNHVVVILPKANKANINTLADLAKAGVRLVGCDPQVPIGNYTSQVIKKLDDSGKYGAGFATKINANMKSIEPNVKAVVTKVVMGDADAGFCYASDVTKNVVDDLIVLQIPKEYDVMATAYIGVVKDCPSPELGREFIATVLSDEGQAIMKKLGILPIAEAPVEKAAE